MSLERNNFASGDDESARDDLRRVTGVGQVYAKALYQIGIRRFADLILYTPQALSQALLERAGVRAKADKIESEDWIGQARRLAEEVQLRVPYRKRKEAQRRSQTRLQLEEVTHCTRSLYNVAVDQ